MHDLTYAKEIITAVTEKMKTLDQDSAISAINTAVSPLSHVKPETLKETFAALVKGTPLEHLILNVQPLDLDMKCASCNAGFSVNKPTFLCPKCHSKNLTIVHSKEFLIESIEVKIIA